MRKLRMTGFVLMLSLVSVGCKSPPPAPKTKPPDPPAWLMAQALDLQQMLNSIIGVSETESPQSPSN